MDKKYITVLEAIVVKLEAIIAQLLDKIETLKHPKTGHIKNLSNSAKICQKKINILLLSQFLPADLLLHFKIVA